MGISFDGFRVLKGKLHIHKFITFMVDVSFGIIAATLTFYLLLLSNNGQLRVVLIFMFFLGIIIYYLTFSSFIIKLWYSLFRLIYHLWLTLMKIVNYTVIKPIQLLVSLVITLITFLLSIIISIGNFFKKIFYFLFGGIYQKTKRTGNHLKGKIQKKAGLFKSLKKVFRKK